MTGASPSMEPSGLGCRLHDWTLAARDGVQTVPLNGRRGLIVDLDDTLYPREDYVQSGLLAVARHLEETRGVPALEAFSAMTRARANGQSGRELQALCAAYGLPAAAIPGLLEVFRAHRPLLRLPAMSRAVLARLRAEHWQLAIVTNGLPSVQRAKVAALGLASLVDHIVYADEHTPGGKPAASVFRHVLRKLGLPARRAILVGDDPRCDIAGARAVGIRTIRLITPAYPGPFAGDADVTIDTIDALPAAMAALLDLVASDAA